MGYKFETLKTKYGVKARITLGVSMLAPTSQHMYQYGTKFDLHVHVDLLQMYRYY